MVTHSRQNNDKTFGFFFFVNVSLKVNIRCFMMGFQYLKRQRYIFFFLHLFKKYFVLLNPYFSFLKFLTKTKIHILRLQTNSVAKSSKTSIFSDAWHPLLPYCYELSNSHTSPSVVPHWPFFNYYFIVTLTSVVFPNPITCLSHLILHDFRISLSCFLNFFLGNPEFLFVIQG